MKNHNLIFNVSGYLAVTTLRTCSSIILWVDFTLIFSLLSYHWHAEPTTVGLATALYGLPGLMLGPFFGRLADLKNPIFLLYGSYIARGITSLLLVFSPTMDTFV